MTKHIKTIDQLGDEMIIPHPPSRIISLVPSQTELLFDLGAAGTVVGVTKFCVHPKEARAKTIIGGTKKFNFDRIHDLSPSLIIGNKEENYLQGIAELRKHYPVWMSDIATLDDAIAMIMAIGEIVDKSGPAGRLVSHIKRRFISYPGNKRGTALYFIWQDPYMVAGKGTFIDEMLRYAGFENAVGDLARYPELTVEQVRSLDPRHIFLSSEPYPFRAKHLDEFKETFPGTHISLVDGEYFSWYGSRLVSAMDYFESLSF